MRFVCESCRAQYMINDDKVGPKGVKVRCRKCGYVITVKRPEAMPKPPEVDDDAMATQVMTPHPSPSADEKGNPKENFLGADDDEIGAVFDQVLRSGPTAAPKGGIDGAKGGPLSTEFDEHESTRVIDAATVAQLAKESSTNEPLPEKIEAAPESNWFVAINEKQTGPLTLDKVKEHWDKGEVGPDSLCWREGFQDWLPLSEVKSLAVVLAPKPPRPIVVPAATIPAAPAVVSVPVQSAFSAGGVVQTVQGEVQVAMPAVPASGPEESGAWKPSAASALASLVKDEMDALAKPPAKESPPPAPAPSAGRLIDVPEGAVSAPLAAPVPRSSNPYAENSAATYSAPAVTAYRPPTNRGLVIGLGAVVGVVLVGLIGTVGWLVFGGGRVAPVAQPSPPVAQVAQVPPTTPTTTTTAPAAAAKPLEAAPPTGVQPPAGVQPPPGTTAVPPVAAAPKDSSPAKDVAGPRSTGPTRREATRSTEAKEPREPRESREPPKETAKEPAKDVKEPQGSGGDEFESAFGKTPTRREEPKRAEPTVRRESYVPPPPGAGSDVKESLGNSDIMEVVLANKPALIKCSDEEHQKEPGTTGKLVMRWSIQSNGKVSNVVVVSEEFKNTYMAACVGKVIKSWTFPRSKNPPEPFTLPVKF